MDQAFIEQIVSKVLAQLQPVPARPEINDTRPEPAKPTILELTAPIITADLLAGTVKPGQAVKFGRKSIVTPSARDWLNSTKTTWSRQSLHAESNKSIAGGNKSQAARWQLMIQTVTPNVRALQDSLKRQPEGWQVELMGQPMEAVKLASAALSTAERDGIVVISDFAELVACLSNRNERIRAAVVADRKQLELTFQHLGANLVCVNPTGKTFMELRNLLRDCAAVVPRPPAGLVS